MVTEVKAPFQYFIDTNGDPLEGGYIYVGTENLNPITSPKAAYWDSALTIPATAIRTTIGCPSYGGSPGRIYVDGAYSILVKNSAGLIIYLSLSMQEDIDSASFLAAASLASIKNSIEYGAQLFDIIPNIDHKVPTEWNPLTPNDYNPRLCLTDFDTYKDITTSNWPTDAISKIRDIKITLKDGLSGELSSPVVTAWAIAANVATLTFQNDADHIAFLTDLLEDESQHGSYTGWRTTTLPLAIGDITAGTYDLTNVNASTRQVSFAFTAGNNSGSGTYAAYFYAYRVSSSTTTARVFSARGLSVMGANDANLYFMSGGVRRRGHFQRHRLTLDYSVYTGGALTNAQGVFKLNNSDTGTIMAVQPQTDQVVSDGTNGTPRTGKETYSPSMSVHLYMHLRRYTV